MADSLREFALRLERIQDPAALRRIALKGGEAAKKASLATATRDLGGDRAFSGMRRRVPLNVGYDQGAGTSVVIKYRPAGMWVLAEAGRRASGPIYPRAGSRKGRGSVRGRAVLTPQGPRARSSFRPSRGQHTLTDAVEDAKRNVPKAAAKQFNSEVARIVR